MAVEVKREEDWLDRFARSSFGRQFIGSDVYIGYTARYVWQANQLGHFTLGFAVGYLLFWLCVLVYWVLSLAGCFTYRGDDWVYPCDAIFGFIGVGWIPLIVIGLYMVLYGFKEYGDYVLATRTYGRVFDLDDVEIARIRRDGVIDAGFVAFGALLVLVAPPAVLIPLALGAIVSLRVRSRELAEKDFIDRANLPFFYALPVFVHDLNRKEDREKKLAAAIRIFARGRGGGDYKTEHVLIAGAKGSGKTSLAAAIGAELAINAHKAVYHSYAALVDADPAEQMTAEEVYAKDGRPNHWGLFDAQYLVVDEVPPAWTGGEVAAVLDTLPEAIWTLIKSKPIRTTWVIALPSQKTPGMPRDVDIIDAWGKELAPRLGTAWNASASIPAQAFPWVRLVPPDRGGKPRMAV